MGSIPSVPDSGWVMVSPDGFFHHRFERALADQSVPRFWISADGTTWSEASVVSVQRVAKRDTASTWEVCLEPLNPKDLIVLVTGTPPAGAKP
jgi:hypothetical protein